MREKKMDQTNKQLNQIEQEKKNNNSNYNQPTHYWHVLVIYT